MWIQRVASLGAVFFFGGFCLSAVAKNSLARTELFQCVQEVDQITVSPQNKSGVYAAEDVFFFSMKVKNQAVLVVFRDGKNFLFTLPSVNLPKRVQFTLFTKKGQKPKHYSLLYSHGLIGQSFYSNFRVSLGPMPADWIPLKKFKSKLGSKEVDAALNDQVVTKLNDLANQIQQKRIAKEDLESNRPEACWIVAEKIGRGKVDQKAQWSPWLKYLKKRSS